MYKGMKGKKFWGVTNVAAMYGPAASGGSPPTLTSSGHNATAGKTITVPTINTGDIVVVLISGYGHSPGSTASSTNLGSFTSAFDANITGAVLWAKNTGSNLTNEVITTSDATASIAIAISGANASPFDGSVVGVTSPGAGSISVTTTHANDLIIAMMGSGSGTADGSPWTSLGGGAYGDVTEYQAVTVTNTYTASFGGQTGQEAIIFGIKGN
jgi:hypothetical protein